MGMDMGMCVSMGTVCIEEVYNGVRLQQPTTYLVDGVLTRHDIPQPITGQDEHIIASNTIMNGNVGVGGNLLVLGIQVGPGLV